MLSFLLSLTLLTTTPTHPPTAIKLLPLTEAEPDLRAFRLQSLEGKVLQRVQSVEPNDSAEAHGFILDLGLAPDSTMLDSMRVELIDRRTLYAYAPSPSNGHIARTRIHLSAPYDTFQIRREKVKLRTGQRVPHCAIALTFKTEDKKPIVVSTF